MQTSYKNEDVTLLLKDISGSVTPQSSEERERLIQGGVHYCEMLPLEYRPSDAYLEAYSIALKNYARSTADALCRTAELVYRKKGKAVVLVSLARAGLPVGILMKHYLDKKYALNIPHYGISIIRGKGIDHNAIRYLIQHYPPDTLQFVDGWIGKGAILDELASALKDYPGISPDLAVLADPAKLTELCGTHEDILIPCSCLNCTVSGLVSRTFLRDDLIGEHDFHGAAYYGDLINEDSSYDFIHSIEKYFDMTGGCEPAPSGISSETGTGLDEVKEIAEYFQVSNLNFIKPGIGEATRVLLRRVPWKLLISERHREDPVLLHLFRLASEKNVPIAFYPLKHYKACGIIKNYSDI